MGRWQAGVSWRARHRKGVQRLRLGDGNVKVAGDGGANHFGVDRIDFFCLNEV